jgi:hypothetical protein
MGLNLLSGDADTHGFSFRLFTTIIHSFYFVLVEYVDSFTYISVLEYNTYFPTLLTMSKW